MRLQKFLSECGVASRRKSEELISMGKVKVNGRIAQIGDKINPKRDTVTVSGKRVVSSKNKYYIMLHKPRGFVTTLSDEMDRRCVADLVKDIPERIYPVGRLDKDSEGLLLMTNDGDFANAMMHPKHHVPKTYRVTVRQNVTENMVDQLAVGIVIEGRKTAPADVRVLLKEDTRTVLEIILYEGRNREIRIFNCFRTQQCHIICSGIMFFIIETGWCCKISIFHTNPACTAVHHINKFINTTTDS